MSVGLVVEAGALKRDATGRGGSGRGGQKFRSASWDTWLLQEVQ